MTVANHILTGVGISMVVRQPALATVFALMSHIVLDVLPHYGQDVFERMQKVYIADAIVSVLIAVAVLLLIHDPATPVLMACMFAAYIPDIVWIRYFFTEWRLGQQVPHGWFARIHHGIQWGERPWGMLVEVPYALVVLGFIAWRV